MQILHNIEIIQLCHVETFVQVKWKEIGSGSWHAALQPGASVQVYSDVFLTLLQIQSLEGDHSSKYFTSAVVCGTNLGWDNLGLGYLLQWSTPISGHRTLTWIYKNSKKFFWYIKELLRNIVLLQNRVSLSCRSP